MNAVRWTLLLGSLLLALQATSLAAAAPAAKGTPTAVHGSKPEVAAPDTRGDAAHDQPGTATPPQDTEGSNNPQPAQGGGVNLATPPPAVTSQTGAIPPETPGGVQAVQQTVLLQTGECLLFGLICLLLQGTLLFRTRASPEAVLRNVTVTLVVTLGIAVVMTGYPQTQISPIIGLFGTIIGFLLGQQVRPSEAPPVLPMTGAASPASPSSTPNPPGPLISAPAPITGAQP